MRCSRTLSTHLGSNVRSEGGAELEKMGETPAQLLLPCELFYSGLAFALQPCLRFHLDQGFSFQNDMLWDPHHDSSSKFLQGLLAPHSVFGLAHCTTPGRSVTLQTCRSACELQFCSHAFHVAAASIPGLPECD